MTQPLPLINSVLSLLQETKVESEIPFTIQKIFRFFLENEPQVVRQTLILRKESRHVKKVGEWHERALKTQDPEAIYRTGYHLEEGIGFRADMHRAVEWYLLASAKGCPRALRQLGLWIGSEAPDSPHNKSFGVYCLVEAAKKQDKKAQYRLGICYENGEGVAPDPEKALFWYSAAAKQGLYEAEVALKDCYQNERFPLLTLEKAALKGHWLAQVYLGDKYRTDQKKAYFWYLKAAKQGWPFQ